MTAKLFLVSSLLSVAWFAGCGSSGHYSRGTGTGGGPEGGAAGDNSAGGAGGDSGSGTGGEIIVGSGGMTGAGGTGAVGTGGAASGGRGSGGGTGTGGNTGSGGVGSGGSAGRGSAGNGSGGGPLGSGGVASGGIGSGGMATGGIGTGGIGTGGVGTGGMTVVRIISVDFAGGQGTVPAPTMGPTESAGFKPATHWNNAAAATGSLANLNDKDGAATGTAMTWTAAAIFSLGYPDAPGDARMMNGYLDPMVAATPGRIVVSAVPAAITAAGAYDVYVYVSGNVLSGQTRTYLYAIGATTITVSQTGPPPTGFTGYTLAPPAGAGNYIVFRGVTGPAFTLTATPGTGSLTRAPVNGIQIVSPTGS